jgi:hypothetical protein
MFRVEIISNPKIYYNWLPGNNTADNSNMIVIYSPYSCLDNPDSDLYVRITALICDSV